MLLLTRKGTLIALFQLTANQIIPNNIFSEVDSLTIGFVLSED